MLPQVHEGGMRGQGPPSPSEQLRLALLDLEKANRDFVKHYSDPAQAELAARIADEARHQASRWAALLRERERLGED